MLVDANILLFAVDEASPFHRDAADWMTEQLNGPGRLGFPWLALGAFLRISTNPRASAQPLSSADAWAYVENWLSAAPAWMPVETDRHAEILGGLIRKYHLTANLISDGQIAALALEHGLTVCSADTDFARFQEIRWTNPVAPS